MSFKYYRITPLILLILFLSVLIDKAIYEYLLPLLKEHNIEFLRAPGNASLIASFLLLYDMVLWRIPIFSLLVKIPDIRGRYIGKLKYQFNGEDGESDCVVEVSQTSSKIKIHSYFQTKDKPNTESKSLVESIVEEDGFYKIYLYYFNSGSKENSELDCHEGANMLKFIPSHEGNPQKLIGHYFTSRKIQTKGKMEVEFESLKRKGTF